MEFESPASKLVVRSLSCIFCSSLSAIHFSLIRQFNYLKLFYDECRVFYHLDEDIKKIIDVNTLIQDVNKLEISINRTHENIEYQQKIYRNNENQLIKLNIKYKLNEITKIEYNIYKNIIYTIQNSIISRLDKLKNILNELLLCYIQNKAPLIILQQKN